MKKKKQLLVDMDHVMADITTQFIKWYKDATGTIMHKENLLGKPEDLAFPNPQLIREFVYTPGFFRKLEVMPGCRAVIKELNEAYELWIVSAAMEFPQSLIEKQEWLAEHFPFISWRQIIFCGSKKNISGDIMIDDHIKNLDNFNGEKLLFTATHNIHMESKGYTRIHNWMDVSDILLKHS